MFEQTVDTPTAPHITVAECLGDLVVRGSERPRVTLRLQRGEADDVTLEQQGDTITVKSRADCILTCPSTSTITIHAVRGDLGIKKVAGNVTIATVYGDVRLRGVGPTVLEQAYGDLSARQVEGDLRVQSLTGDARVRQVEGTLSVGQIGSDLKAEGIRGGLTVEQVGADAVLGPPFSPGATYRVNTGSDLRVRVPAQASLRLVLRAMGQVRSRLPGLVLEEADGETHGVLGAGEATLEAQAGGRIYLRPAEPEGAHREDIEFDPTNVEELGAQIEASITAAMAEVEERLQESLSRIDDQQLRRRVKQTAEKARRKAAREAEKARMRAERAERRWQRASGRRSRTKHEPATDEERMRVLSLVEEGKLTPEQAADLLAALEGR